MPARKTCAKNTGADHFTVRPLGTIWGAKGSGRIRLSVGIKPPNVTRHTLNLDFLITPSMASSLTFIYLKFYRYVIKSSVIGNVHAT